MSTERTFRFKPRVSKLPLSLGELIALIDRATGHLDGVRSLADVYAISVAGRISKGMR